MKIGVMQPYLFPYVGYFQLMSAVDKFILLDDVNYIKGGWINRNCIIINNEVNRFTIPLQQSSSFIPINELSVVDKKRWKDKFLKTIDQNYNKAPYFSLFFPVVESIINSKYEKIADLVFFSITKINQYLEILTIVEIASQKFNNQNLKGQSRILDICHQEKADHYINSIGGKKLYDPEYFRLNGINFNFIEPHFSEYKQFEPGFFPSLSIIDVLMFNSQTKAKEMLLDFELI